MSNLVFLTTPEKPYMYNLMIGHILRKVRSLYEDGQREIFILHQNSFIFEEAIRECNGAFFFL